MCFPINKVAAFVATRPRGLPSASMDTPGPFEQAKLRGVESNGMLLAAQSGDKVVLLQPDGDMPAGAKVR